MRFIELNNELLTSIAGHLSNKDLYNISLTCHKLSEVVHSDFVWKEKIFNEFGINYKHPLKSWKETYIRKSDDPHNSKLCPHISHVNAKTLEPYIIKYQQLLNWLPKNLNCATCRTHCGEEIGLCLYIWKDNVRHRCKDCAYNYHKSVEGHGILFRINVLQMFCFECDRLLGETRGDPSEAYYIDTLLETITNDSDKGKEAMKKRQQCMEERVLYYEHADRASVVENGKYYFIERVWLLTWFLRLCDGKIGVGPIPNNELEDRDRDGKMNPAARPKGNFTGGFSIVTPYLWDYLVNTYGLTGRTYTSEDVVGPEYDELYESIRNWGLI